MALQGERYIGSVEVDYLTMVPPTYYRTTEPTAEDVTKLVDRRRCMCVNRLIKNTIFLAQEHPVMLLRVRDHEPAVEQRARKRRRSNTAYAQKQMPAGGPVLPVEDEVAE